MKTENLITLFDNDYKTNIKINQSLQIITISQNFYKNGKKKGVASWDYKYYFFNDDLIYNDFIKQYQNIEIKHTKKNLAFVSQFVGGDKFILSRLNLTN
jgi:hypothetical protein